MDSEKESFAISIDANSEQTPEGSHRAILKKPGETQQPRKPRELAPGIIERVSDVFDDYRTGDVHLVQRNGLIVPHFFQGDSRWGKYTLGDRHTIKSAGCAISATAMILAYYGRNVDPEYLDKHLDQHNGYQGDSVIWGTALGYPYRDGPKLTYEGAFKDMAQMINMVNVRLDRDEPVLARIDYNNDMDFSYDHFVVIVGRNADGDFIMNDPGFAEGDGAGNPDNDECIIQRTRRNGGYNLVEINPFLVG